MFWNQIYNDSWYYKMVIGGVALLVLWMDHQDNKCTGYWTFSKSTFKVSMNCCGTEI